jgi:hypothetical protein
MKRSNIVKEIATELKDIIMENYIDEKGEEWCAELILTRIEELGFRLTEVVNYGYDGSELQIQPYEPEEGWDSYFAEQDKKDNARDFEIVPLKNIYTGEIVTSRSIEISEKFLAGKSFEELANEYKVTRERIRQIVAKQRRRYQRHIEGKNDE